MYYVIFAQDNPNMLETRLAVRPAHLARLEQLQSEGRLLTAGPNPTEDGSSVTGSTVIAEFESLADAQAAENQRDQKVKSDAAKRTSSNRASSVAKGTQQFRNFTERKNNNYMEKILKQYSQDSNE